MSLLNYHQLDLIYQNPGAGVAVYRAYHQVTQNPVVIKQMSCVSLAQANAAITESLIQARLSHPHICSMYECFLQQQDSGFLAVLVVEQMETDLYKEIARRAERQEYWSEREVVKFLEDLAGALAYAETQGVAHRDLKPQNLFLSAEGLVKIGDFGSAAFSLERSMRNTLQGSPFFLSPELKQAYLNSLTGMANTDSYNPYASDVYSLGLTVLHMALLEAPVALAVLERLEEHTVETLERVAQWPTLKFILYYMLAVNQAQRPGFQYIADYCRHQLNPQESQSIPSGECEATVSLPVRSSRPICFVCNSVVSSNTSWQDNLEPELRTCIELLAKVCSKACFITAATGQALDPAACLQDWKLLSRNSLFFDCGHGFCSQGCLSKYLANEPYDKDGSISFQCKVCRRSYEEEHLRQFYKGNLREVVRSGRNRRKCMHCNQRCSELTLDCGHFVSLQCSALIKPPNQPARLICPVCSKSQVWNNS